MAKNYQGEGDVLDFTAGATPVVSGAAVLMGARLGIALADIPALETGSVAVTGVWSVQKAAGAVAQGALVYWDQAAEQLTTVDEGNTLAGFAAAPAAAGAADVRIKINA
jgi:predicted RecA/RadA family phage recombinase